MSFLQHDMSPLDPLTLKEPRNHEKAKKFEAETKRAIHQRTDISDFKRPPTGNSVQKHGMKSVPYDHFANQGINLDGSKREHIEPKNRIKSKQSDFEHPTVLNGIQSRSDAETSKQRKKLTQNPNDPPVDQSEIAKQREEYRQNLKSQVEEKKRLKQQESNAQDAATSLEIKNTSIKGPVKIKAFSNHQKYGDKSMVEPPKSRHEKTLEGKVAKRDQELLDTLKEQAEEKRISQKVQRQEQSQVSDGVYEQIHRLKTPNKARLSHEYTAGLSMEKNYRTKAEKESKQKESVDLRDTLQIQMQQQKGKGKQHVIEDGKTSNGRDLEGKFIEKKKDHSLDPKINDNGRQYKLYEEMVTSEHGYDEQFGKQEIPRNTIKEKDPRKLKEQESFRNDLKSQNSEKEESRRRQMEEERALEKQHAQTFPYNGIDDPRNPKVKVNRPTGDADISIKYRQEQKQKFKKELDESYELTQKSRQEQEQQEKEELREAEQSDPWQWNKDLQRQKSPRKQEELDEEVQQFRIDLKDQYQDSERRHQEYKQKERQEMLEHNDQHFVAKMGKKNRPKSTNQKTVQRRFELENNPPELKKQREAQPKGLKSHNIPMYYEVPATDPRRTRRDNIKDMINEGYQM